MASWQDFYKLWTYALTKGPIEKQASKNLDGVGVLHPEAIPDLRSDDYFGSGKNQLPLRNTNDFIDLSNVTSRANRYKEYDRLRNIPEIETAMTIFADEACIAGDTIIETLAHGKVTIKWLTEYKSEDRFLVYCWDFDKKDFSLGWAYNPRKTGERETVKVSLNDGKYFICTPDHRVLLKTQEWIQAGDLKYGDQVIAFHRLPPPQTDVNFRENQFNRIYTHTDGWTHERLFINKWRDGDDGDKEKRLHKTLRLLTKGVSQSMTAELVNFNRHNIDMILGKYGFNAKEAKFLGNKNIYHRVLGVNPWKKIDVYDLSVENHQCFASDSVIFHNCQKGNNGHICEVVCDCDEVKEEIEWLLFSLLKVDKPEFAWDRFKQLCIYGDEFWEKITNPENPSGGIVKVKPLPAETMFRIETTKGKLIEFQQNRDAPDYQSLMKSDPLIAPEHELMQSTGLRFAPDQIVHIRINDNRKTFYPYGVSLIEAARGPAHSLRLMEDAMLVYRLCLTENSYIRHFKGIKSIKDVVAQDLINSFDIKTKLPISSRVTWKNSLGEKDVFTVKSKHYSITGTEDHPVLVIKDKKIQYLPLGKLDASCRLFSIKNDQFYIKKNNKEIIRIGAQSDRKKHIKEIPSWVFHLMPECRKAYIQGLCGSVKRKAKKIKSQYPKLLYGIKEIWTSIGLCSSNIENQSIIISNKKLPKSEPVISVTYSGKQNVYDIGVDSKEHNFIVNGIVVHNSRAPERRVFYIDVGGLAPYRAESFIERMKSMLKKKKTANNYGGAGPSAVDERRHIQSFDEDYWIPTRAGSNTRIETLPGAQNLDEIGDVLHFRNKVFVALNFPKDYMSNEDPAASRMTLSNRSIQFSRLIERLQSSFEGGLLDICITHLKLKGFPEESYEDLKIMMTPPSSLQELSEAEVITNRINNAIALKGSTLISDFDILTRTLKYTEEEAKVMISRTKIQKLEELQMQIYAQNPSYLGIGLPGEGDVEIGVDSQGPNMELDPAKLQDNQNQDNQVQDNPNQEIPEQDTQKPTRNAIGKIPDPSEEDIKKYDLSITNYAVEQDFEDIDYSES